MSERPCRTTRLVGFRLLDGFDISERYALELPDVLLRAIDHRWKAQRVAMRMSTR